MIVWGKQVLPPDTAWKAQPFCYSGSALLSLRAPPTFSTRQVKSQATEIFMNKSNVRIEQTFLEVFLGKTCDRVLIFNGKHIIKDN